MAEQKRGGLAIQSYISSWIVEHWLECISVLFTGGGMAYLAAFTDWMKPWGPIGWAAIGFLSMIIVIGCYAIYWWARRYKTTIAFTEKLLQSTTINPLSDNFSKQRIKLVDFFNTFYQPVKTTKFQDCELLGPSNFYPTGCSFHSPGFINCQVVIIAQNKKIIGATQFNNCIFERCRFFEVIFYMEKDEYLSWKIELGAGIEKMTIISDGNAGNL
jgi:hypothetical protein